MIDSEFEQKIVRLQNEETESWRERAKANYAGDRKAADNATLRMIAIDKELMGALRAEGLKFQAELRLKPADDDDAKVNQLLIAFARGIRLSRIWRDVIHQARISMCCVGKVFSGVQAVLDTMNRRGDLAIFLDDPDQAIRSRAASLLLDRMPDRCVPILQEISRKEGGSSAGITAFWALAMYENGAIPKHKTAS